MAFRPFVLSLLAVLIPLSCEPVPRKGPEPFRGTAYEFFQQSDPIVLEEPGELIGQIGAFFETESGGFLVGDAILPKVRLFDSAGQLQASFGGSGEGPNEFRNVKGIAQNSSGETLVVDSKLGRMTVLSADLQPVRTVRPRPIPRGDVLRMGDGILLVTAPGSRRISVSRVTDDGAGIWNVTPPTFDKIMEVPYWGGASTMPVAATSDFLAAAFSLLYPIYLYDGRGALTDSLVTAPMSFRTAPQLEPGALYGVDEDVRREDWLNSFDIIADLAVVADSLLVVTHGDLVSTSANLFEEVHRRVDVYHILSRRKLAEDVSLPEGSRVLGGGSALYLLISEPPEPWAVVRLSPR